MAKIEKTAPTKNGDARWRVKWVVGRKESGKPIYKSQSCTTHRDAVFLKAEKQLLERPKRQRFKNKYHDRPSFEVVAGAFLHSLEHPEPGVDPKEPVTLRAYGSVLSEHVFPVVGDKLVAHIEAEDFRRVYQLCNQMGMSPRTRNEALRLMRAVLRYAVATGHLENAPENPIKAKLTAKEKDANRDAAEKKFYSPDEVYTMLAAAESLAKDGNKQTRRTWARYHPLLAFLVYTGARISEARAFRRQDYSSQERRVHIRQSAPEGKGSMMTKTAAGRRWVPMNPELSEIIEPWMAMHDRELVFGTNNDKPISLPTLYPRLLGTLKDRADLLAASGQDPRFVEPARDRQFHAFRHHYASWLVKEGVNLKQLQKYMGHTKASFTLDVYGHLFEDDGQDLVSRMTMRQPPIQNVTFDQEPSGFSQSQTV